MSDGEHEDSDILAGAVHLGEFCASCLGPNGQRKLIELDDGTVVTRDIHRIFDSVRFSHPVTRLLAQRAVTQKENTGDGSLSMVVIASELADRASDLLDDGYLRRTIQDGYREANRVATERLAERADEVSLSDRPTLRDVARTALNAANPELVDVIVDAATQLEDGYRSRNRDLDLPDIKLHVNNHGGSVQAELIQGTVIERDVVYDRMARTVASPTIAILGGGKKAGSGIEERSLFRAGGSKGKGRTEVTYQIEEAGDREEFNEGELEQVRKQVARLEDLDVDVLFCTMGISDAGKRLLHEAGIVAFRGLLETDAAFLARATGAAVVMDLEDIDPEDLGVAGQASVDTDSEQAVVRVTDCPNSDVATIALSGPLKEYRNERERDLRTSISSVLGVLDGDRVVPGGGQIEISAARAVRDAATGTGDRRAIPMKEFAGALETIPRALVENAGRSSVEAATAIRANDVPPSIDRAYPDDPVLPEDVVRSTWSTATRISTRFLRIDDTLEGSEDDEWIEASEMDPRPEPSRDFDY